MSKATRNPRVSVLRWALVTKSGTFLQNKVRVLTWSSRRLAREERLAGDRVVRVRVTVEVVE